MKVFLEYVELGEVDKDCRVYEVLNLLPSVGADPKGHYTAKIKDNEIHLHFA